MIFCPNCQVQLDENDRCDKCGEYWGEPCKSCGEDFCEGECCQEWDDDGQPDEYTEWQDVYGGDVEEYGTFGDYDHGDDYF